jgi:hypothetical protein
VIRTNQGSLSVEVQQARTHVQPVFPPD